MTGNWRALRQPAKALTTLCLLLSAVISVAAMGSSRAGVLSLALNFSSAFASPIISIALTSDSIVGDGDARRPESRLVVRAMTVSSGDTLASMLAVAAIDRRDISASIITLRKRFNPRRLRIGQKLFVIVEVGNRGADRLVALSLELSKTSYLIIEKRSGRRYVWRYMTRPLQLDVEGYGTASKDERVLRFQAGDTLSRILVRAGAGRDNADKASRAIGRLVNLRRLQIGQEVTLSFASDDRGTLTAVSLKISRNAYVTALRNGRGGFTAQRAASPAVVIDPPVAKSPAGAAPEVAIADSVALDDDSRQIYQISKGDTLTGALIISGVDLKPAYALADVIGRYMDLRKLRIGQKVILVFDPGSTMRKGGIAAVSLKVGTGKYVVAGRNQAGGFNAEIAGAPLLPVFSADDAVAASAIIPLPQLQVTAAATYKALSVRSGDTLTTALLRIGSAWSEADAVVAALSRLVDTNRLQADQELTAVLDKLDSYSTRPQLVAVNLTMSEGAYVVARRNDDDSFTAWRTQDPLEGIFDEALAAAPPPPVELSPIPATAVQKSITVRPGDTLMKALLKAGSDPQDAEAAIVVLKPLFDPRSLRAGQRLKLAFSPAASGGESALLRLTINISPGRDVEAGRIAAGGFAARVVEASLEKLMVHTGGIIDSSLYKAAIDAGIPVPVLWKMISAFSYDVDFQREIQRGDGFEVMFERYLDDTGTAVREGDIIYASLTLSGTELRIYRHTDNDGFADFYNEAGHSVRKSLLRTPIDGARLTSGFGRRKHPVLGYTKMHRGVDFGARQGTPFMAAGDGVVERAGWNGAYGKYIRIRHRNGYSTAYAHLSRIASGVLKGRRVKQGQVVGYVGSTGRSTGPHLHYEVLRGGKQINPLKVKLPTGTKLKGAALATFQKSRVEIKARLASLPLVNKVADALLPAE